MRWVRARLTSGPRASKRRSRRSSLASSQMVAGSSTWTRSTMPGTRSRRGMASNASPRPGEEDGAYITKVPGELWQMARQDSSERVVGDPGESGWRVDFGREVIGIEAIALEPSRCHQDKDAKGSVG